MMLARCATRHSGVATAARQSMRRMSAATSSMETDEYVIFPRERPGLDYDLNWSLNKDGVTPSGDAFRLTKPADLKKLGLKPKKTTPKGTVEEAKEGSYAAIDSALESVKATLSASPTLYVAEGDAPGTRIACRVITDSPDIAAAGILERMPKRQAMSLPITAFVTSGGPDFKGFVVEQNEEDANVASLVLTGADATGPTLAAGITAAAKAWAE